MDGFYSLWTEPFLKAKGISDYEMADYELLTFIISALEWKKNNGELDFICDSSAAKYLNKNKLDSIIGFDIKDLKVDKDINQHMFWAAGKLYALQSLEQPKAMVDLDLIVWKKMDEIIGDADIYGIHREEIRPEVYPDFDYFRLKDGVAIPDDYDKEILPLNTAFLYIKDLDFIKKYTEEAIWFMKNSVSSNDNLKYMVFAEQRLISIMASKYNKKIETMFDLGQNIGYQECFTHIWGHKNILKYNINERIKYCKRIIGRIEKDFPDVYEKIFSILDREVMA